MPRRRSTYGICRLVDQSLDATAIRRYRTSCARACAPQNATRAQTEESIKKPLCGDDRSSTVAHVKRAEDRKQMNLDGTLGDAQMTRDHLVGLAARQQANDIQLALGESEPSRSARRSGVGQRNAI